jgi:hypothetical protein
VSPVTHHRKRGIISFSWRTRQFLHIEPWVKSSREVLRVYVSEFFDPAEHLQSSDTCEVNGVPLLHFLHWIVQVTRRNSSSQARRVRTSNEK